MDPGWKNLVHKYKTRAVMIELQQQTTRRRSVETNSTKSWMKTNIHLLAVSGEYNGARTPFYHEMK